MRSLVSFLGGPGRSALLFGWVLIAACDAASALELVAEKVPPLVADRQAAQAPDAVHLGGWVGGRILANEVNRLVRLDPNRLLEAYRQRPGRQIWEGEHVGKWLHAATLAWVHRRSPELRAKLEHVVAELLKCQLADGYLGTYVEANRWTMWDVWAHKYNLLGLITYMRHTGDLRPLPACQRMADLLCRTFGDTAGRRDINTSSQHKGMASTSVLEPMVLLYRLTGESRYLEFCRYLLRAWEQPNGAKILSTLLAGGGVDQVGNAKAYEMLSCLIGALELYRTTGEKDLLEACRRAWQDVVDRRLYLTGTASYREFFRAANDLPSHNNVGETCVTVTWLQFNAQLLRLTGEACFADQLERTVLNHLLGAQKPDGTAWGYYVQLQGRKPYSDTLEGHCCLSSGPRGMALIPTFATSVDAEGVVVNLYEAGRAILTLRDATAVTIETRTHFPSEERVELTVSSTPVRTFAVKLRLPPWSRQAGLRLNGRPLAAAVGPDGYAAIRREWGPGDRLELELQFGAHILVGDRYQEGCVAVQHGPLVLAADEATLAPGGGTLRAYTAAGADASRLQVTPEPAPPELRSWSHARVFRINAALGESAGSAGQSPTYLHLVPFADAGQAGTAYRVWIPSGPPRADRNLLVTGIEIRSRKPHAGSIIDGDVATIAATFDARSAAEDWFGVTLDEPVEIGRVVFIHGRTFPNGGWFDTRDGRPMVQFKASAEGPWETVGELPDYPAATAREAAGLQGGESFSLRLETPRRAVAVRVAGRPASGANPRQAFASCAELQAFGPGH